MGKALIIKGADFSTNAVDTISELYEEITDTLINGFVSISGSNTPGPGTLYNASYNSTSAIIPNYLVLMVDSTTLYNTNGKGVEWFLPQGLIFRCWAFKPTSTIGSNGVISDSYIKPSSQNVYIQGSGEWVKSSDIYSNLGVSDETYPCYMGTIARVADAPVPALSLADAKALGLKVRKLKEE